MAEKKKAAPKKATSKKIKKDEMVEVKIHNTNIPIDGPERTIKIMFENNYCRIVENWDEKRGKMFYIMTDKARPENADTFPSYPMAENEAKNRRWM